MVAKKQIEVKVKNDFFVQESDGNILFAGRNKKPCGEYMNIYAKMRKCGYSAGTAVDFG